MRRIALVPLLFVLTACASPEVTQLINDPYEKQNRQVHAFNKAVDTRIVKPLTSGMGGDQDREPGPVMRGVSNFAGNLDTPRRFVNDVLQANADDASHNMMRFLINTTIGFAGIFDPATVVGLEERPSDFGETLHVWGAEEGVYVELPIFGPSTSRDAAGKAVDFFLNPLDYVLEPPESYVLPVASIASRVTDRAEYGEAVDDVLYGSADSYAQARLLYLQNRRFQLGQTVANETEDPYALDTEGF